MKLSGRGAVDFFRKPDLSKSGILVYGQDAMRVALRRQELIRALVGPEGEEEMRLTRLTGADARKEPARILDSLKAQGFFPGHRVLFLEDASDGLSGAIGAALEAWQDGDAQMVVTAGQLNTRSSLRKLFEAADSTVAIGIYDDPPSRAEIEATLASAGLTGIDRDAMADLEALGRALDPGEFRMTAERIALYKRGDAAPLSSEEIADLAPASIEAAVDDILHVVAESRHGEIGPLMARLRAQGISAVALSIAATRHFRALHAAASDPKGPAAGLARVKPPVFGPRRDRMGRQAQSWGVRKLEDAVQLLIDTDLTLRSRSRAPEMGVMERTLIRIAMMGARS